VVDEGEGGASRFGGGAVVVVVVVVGVVGVVVWA